jgi:hypothetical protein
MPYFDQTMLDVRPMRISMYNISDSSNKKAASSACFLIPMSLIGACSQEQI